MLKPSSALVMSMLLLQSEFATSQTSTQLQPKVSKEQKTPNQQTQFDALVVRIAKVGIEDVKQLEKILGIELVPISKRDTPDNVLDLKEKELQKGLGIVGVHSSRQFEPEERRDQAALASAYLSIHFDPSLQLSAENLCSEYEYPVYLLNLNSNNVSYFSLNDVNVYLRYKPESGYEGIAEVLFTWNRKNHKPDFPILLDRKKGSTGVRNQSPTF